MSLFGIISVGNLFSKICSVAKRAYQWGKGLFGLSSTNVEEVVQEKTTELVQTGIEKCTKKATDLVEEIVDEVVGTVKKIAVAVTGFVEAVFVTPIVTLTQLVKRISREVSRFLESDLPADQRLISA